MRVLVVSEGLHELGGALQAISERLLKRKAEFCWKKVSSSDVRVHMRKGKGPRLEKRALAWARHARREGFDALVLLIDQDGDPTREPALAAAQNNLRIPLPRALGVAIRTFDAWMLADEQALTQVLGYQVPLQKAPETIADPKRVCDELLDRCETPMAQRRMYATVAEGLKLSVLEERCPRGFAPFACWVRAL